MSLVTKKKRVNEMNYNQVKRKEQKQFIDNLRYLINESGWTYEQATVKIGNGLKLSLFKHWINGLRFPPIAFCRIIAGLFNLTIEDMITKELHKIQKNESL
jgi:hypothetical protein